MRYDKGDDQLNAWSVTKSVGKKLKKLHLDLPRKYKNKQVLDLKIIIYYVYQIQWVIRVGKKYLPQPCQTVRSCKIMYTQKTHAYHRNPLIPLKHPSDHFEIPGPHLLGLGQTDF